MSFLITSDLHLTANARDSYRWGLFNFLQEEVKKHGVSQVLLLGDITDSKDNHNAQLVNRLIKELTSLASFCDLFILFGNHDGISDSSPFFGFVDEFDTNITFIAEQRDYWFQLGKKKIHCLFLPSTRNWREDWDGIDFNRYDLIFTHQTYDGAIAETGIELPGIPPSVFKNYRGRVISGDVHVPQTLLSGKITYCGSPFRIRFGDSFRPRIILYGDDATTQNLHYGCLSKHVLVGSSLDDIIEQGQKVKKGDQVKIRISLPRAELPTWSELKVQIRDQAISLGWELLGLELTAIKETLKPSEPSAVYKHSDEILADFIKAKKLSQKQAEIGLSLIRG